ncbi:MAG: type II/IV secretion system ATPase subunit [Methanocorpusculum sp.]|nr:type II/IV secretion system ATPase subunit [Methanocorpusculum sp.]
MKKKREIVSYPAYDEKRAGPLVKTPPPENATETRWLIPGVVRISIAEDAAGLLYIVSEPELTPFYQNLFQRISSEVRCRLTDGRAETIDEALPLFLSEAKLTLPPRIIHAYRYYLKRDFLRLGKIDALCMDSEIEDISCGGYRHPVFIYHRRFKSMRTNITYSREELDSAVVLYAERGGVQISLGHCMADATLPDGSRLQLTYGDAVSANGSTFSLRRFKKYPLTPVQLINFNTFSIDEMAYLWYAVETGHSVLIIGETASGKTTTLNVLAQFIPPAAKIVSIEDTREIMLYHENWIPNQIPVSGEEEVSMFDLLRAAMRQRPEYLLVGEVRGTETLTMFQAMNTGHVTFSTFHAGDIDSAVHRLLNEPLNVPLTLLESLDIVIAQKTITNNLGYPERRCSEITEIVGMSDMGAPHSNQVFSGGILRNPPAVFSGDTKDWNAEISRRRKALEKMLDCPDYASFSVALKEFYG